MMIMMMMMMMTTMMIKWLCLKEKFQELI